MKLLYNLGITVCKNLHTQSQLKDIKYAIVPKQYIFKLGVNMIKSCHSMER